MNRRRRKRFQIDWAILFLSVLILATIVGVAIMLIKFAPIVFFVILGGACVFGIYMVLECWE